MTVKFCNIYYDHEIPDRDHEDPKAMADVGEVVEIHRVGLGTSPHVPERYRVVAAAGYYAASTRFAGF